MIVQINQVNSFGNNEFQIIKDGQLLYKAQSSWMPMMVDYANKLTMTDCAGNKVFETNYNVLENVGETIIPMKYLITGSQKFHQFRIMDHNDMFVGAFYREVNGLMDGKYYLQYQSQAMVVYRAALGSIEALSFYENDVQVGQMTKALSTVNNLDCYTLHFLPGYEQWLPILSFFTVYHDYIAHNNSGKIMVGYTKSIHYTYSKNQDKYNPNFILDNFGAEEHERIHGKGENSIQPKPMVGPLTLKQFWIIFGVGWGVALLLAGIAVLIFVVMR